MKVDQEHGLLFVFKHKDDPWLRAVHQICTGTLGWEEYEWKMEMDSNGNDCPTLFAQLMTVYCFRGLSPVGAIEELVRHPDFAHLAFTWEENRDC